MKHRSFIWPCFAVLAAGCANPGANAATPQVLAASAAVATAVAPVPMSRIELGDSAARLELTLDSETGRLAGRFVNEQDGTPLPLSNPSIGLVVTLPDVLSPINVTLLPVGNAMTGAASGGAAEFAATVSQLKGRKTFNGSLTGLLIRGRPVARVLFEFPSKDR